MVQVFIEAKRAETPEGVFLETLIRKFIPDHQDYTINAVNGWTNLCQAANVMVMRTNVLAGGKNLVVFDADKEENVGGPYARCRKKRSALGFL